MKYLTIKEMAVRWGVSERTVNKLCAEGRVEGAEKFGSVWSIPEKTDFQKVCERLHTFWRF